ncbi:Nucleo P87 domain containing protein [Pyrenophora tritici-repentis]|nr:Nucleo P87 domain containing protein [Pyrenophora tritici-repentis]
MYTVVPDNVGMEGCDAIRMNGANELCAYFSAILDPIPTGHSTKLGQETRVPNTHTRRSAVVASNYAPSWISRRRPSNNARFSRRSTVVEGAHGSDVSNDHLEDLVDSIENFRFTTMVTTITLNKISDLRTIVVMTSNNLLNAGWDLHRLYMIWSEITADAPSDDVVGILKPWSRLSKERVAKACQKMERALAIHKTWTENMACTRTLAMTLNLMSQRWWRTFDERYRELAMLDPRDVAGQVAVVMEVHLDMKEEVVTPTAPTRRRSLKRGLSTRSSSATRLRNPVLPSVAETTEMEPLEKTRHSIATSHLTRRSSTGSNIPRWSLPATSRIPRPVQSSSAHVVAQPVIITKHAVQDIPNFSRPTKPTSMARQSPQNTTQPEMESGSPPDTQPQTHVIEDPQSNPAPTTTEPEKKSGERPAPSLALAVSPPMHPSSPYHVQSSQDPSSNEAAMEKEGWNARRERARIQSERAVAASTYRQQPLSHIPPNGGYSTIPRKPIPSPSSTSLRSYSSHQMLANSRSISGISSSSSNTLDHRSSLGTMAGHSDASTFDIGAPERESTDSSSYQSTRDSVVRRSRSGSSSDASCASPPLPIASPPPKLRHHSMPTRYIHKELTTTQDISIPDEKSTPPKRVIPATTTLVPQVSTAATIHPVPNQQSVLSQVYQP